MTEEQKRASVRALFGLLGLVAAVGGGIYAHSESSSWALAIFVGFMALYVLGNALPEVITDVDKGRRLAFFTIPLVVAVGGLIAAHALWDEWWLAVLIGFAVGIVGWAISFAAFPKIAEEERLESQERMGAGGPTKTPPGPSQGSWPVNR